MARARKKTERPNIALCYVRVSTGQQAESGLSLDAQERKVIAEAEAAGYTVEVIREEGRSGKNITGRPLLAATLDRLDRGDAAALFVAKLDRLARSAFDALSVKRRADAAGWRLVVTELGADTGSAVGTLVFTLVSAVAEMELAAISERHKAWHAEARARGQVWGVTHGPRSSLPRDVVDRILLERAQGRTLAAIAAGLEADGVPTSRGRRWYPSTVAGVLGSPSVVAP
jgi:DNA invertase Pin-like site-specific DNA recombinase